MANKINEVLENLDFEAREIKIYLALIKEQGLTALQISKKTGIDRTTIYDLLNKLISKGIVNQILKDKTKSFSALSPDKLESHFKEKYSSLKLILPDLKKIANEKKEEIKCELFYGKQGLRNVIKEFILEEVNYKAIGIRKEYEELIGYLADQNIINFNKLKIKETAIVEEDTKFTKLKEGDYKYLKKGSLSATTTLIYKDIVIFIIWEEPYYAIRIKNKTFVKMQENYFKLLWNLSKP